MKIPDKRNQGATVLVLLVSLLLLAGCFSAPEPKLEEFVEVTIEVQPAMQEATATPMPADTATVVPETVEPPTATWTPIVITPLPPPADVLEAAERVREATRQATEVGTATPLPPNVITATFTPVPVIVTNTPTPENEATAEYISSVGTAIALTTGTPSVLAVPVITATPTLTLTPKPTNTPRPTNTPAPPKPTSTPKPTITPTPVLIYVAEMKPTPTATPQLGFPRQLVGKILFKSTLLGERENRPGIYVINPDGSGLAKLTNTWPHARAEERDTWNADKSLRAFALREPGAGADASIQIFLEDVNEEAYRQLTFYGSGISWGPSWSPDGNRLAFTSSASGNDEIWVMDKDNYPGMQLTVNDWQWDHQPSWSPNGNRIVFATNRSGIRQIWIMNADGNGQKPLTGGSYEAWDPVWVKYPDS